MKRKMRRRKGILWEYNWDGVYPYEHIKGFWKRYWRRWLKRIRWKDAEEYGDD